MRQTDIRHRTVEKYHKLLVHVWVQVQNGVKFKRALNNKVFEASGIGGFYKELARPYCESPFEPTEDDARELISRRYERMRVTRDIGHEPVQLSLFPEGCTTTPASSPTLESVPTRTLVIELMRRTESLINKLTQNGNNRND